MRAASDPRILASIIWAVAVAVIVYLLYVTEFRQKRSETVATASATAAAKAAVRATTAEKKTSQVGENQINGTRVLIKNCVAQREYFNVTARTQMQLAANDEAIGALADRIPIVGPQIQAMLLDRQRIENTYSESALALSGNTCDFPFHPVR